jgi:hypothetical protein
MPDPKIEQLAAKVLEAISDPRVCGQGASALRRLVRDQLRSAAASSSGQTEAAIDYAAGQVAGHVEEICRGLPPDVRAVGVVVAAAGAVYGVSQMPEAEIRAMIAGIRAKVIDTRLMIAGEPVQLSVSSTLAPLFGERPSVSAEARWQQRIFGQQGTARLYANDLGGNPTAGGSWSTPLNGGSAEFGANTSNGGTVYFRLQLSW